MCIVQSKSHLAMFAPRHAPLLRPPCLGDADRVRLRESVNSREVRHSLTWHSSKSESALERFEPVAVVQQLPDGRGTLFAPVAARRQKEFKRGIDTYAEYVCRRRRDGSQSFPLFVLFVLFGQAKRTLKDKYHKVTFSFLALLSDQKYQKSARRTRAVLLATTAACTSQSREPCVASVCGIG